MSKFDLENYETVQERINTFNKMYPDGSIITEENNWKETSDGRIIWRAVVSVRKEADGPICGNGTASEIEGANKFAPNNACELAETSARGRALLAIGIGQQASRDEVASARSKEAAPAKVQQDDPWSKGMEILGDALGAEPLANQTTISCAHGVMVYKTGISKKTNKPWAGNFCPGNVEGCETKWKKVG